MQGLKQIIIIVSVICLGCVPCQVLAGKLRITMATLDWEPYVGRHMKNQGSIAVIVKEAFKRSGIDLQIQFHQWSRVVGLAKKGLVDGYFPEYYADSITSYARFSDPIPAGPLGFFKLKDAKIEFSTLKSLTGYRIGIVKGYINSKEFDMADYLEKHPVKDDLTNLKLLLAHRVDLVVADKFVGFYLANRHLPDQVADIEFMPRILENKDVYVCVCNTLKSQAYLLNAFNRGLASMRVDGTLDLFLSNLLSNIPDHVSEPTP